MFFAKRKERLRKQAEARLAALKTTCDDRLDKVEKDISEADSTPDVGARYLRFIEIKDNIQQTVSPAPIKLKAFINPVSDFRGFVLSFFFVEMALQTAHDVTYVVQKATGTAPPTIDDEVDEIRTAYLSSMDRLSQTVSLRQDSLINDRLLDFRSSAHFEDICDKFPQIALKFAKAAARTGLDIPSVVRLDKAGATIAP